MCNMDIRQAAAGAGVRLWQIADAIGLNDGNFFPQAAKGAAGRRKAENFRHYRGFGKGGALVAIVEQLAFTPSQAALAASVSRPTIYRWMRLDGFPGGAHWRLYTDSGRCVPRLAESTGGSARKCGLKRNAPAGAATPARARNEDFAVNHSGFNSNTDGRKTPQIFALLHTGAENGTTLRELVAATGLNERVVRLKIQQERKDGKLILSNNQGRIFPARVPGGCAALCPFHEPQGSGNFQHRTGSRSGACGYDWAGSNSGVGRWLNRNTFRFFDDQLEVISFLTDEQLGGAVRAAMQYMRSGEESVLEGWRGCFYRAASAVFPAARLSAERIWRRKTQKREDGTEIEKENREEITPFFEKKPLFL